MQHLSQPKWLSAWKQQTSRNFSLALASLALSGLLAACGAQSTSTGSNTAAQATSAPVATVVSTTAAISETTTTTQTGTIATSTTKFNLNTVTPEQILTIPNTGNRMVREFQEYRPYVSIAQFRKEIGKYVDEAQVAEYEKYVYVPVNPNEADAATMQQLPGVTEAVANALIAGRPYASNDAFLQKLATQVSAEQVASAGAYLETQ
jgi:DNA uptake protein ComE-like DNA-binding protein